MMIERYSEDLIVVTDDEDREEYFTPEEFKEMRY